MDELPQSLLQAMARPPRPGRLKAIKHVVFLMQENRSFDHYFGSGFHGVRGFKDRNLVTLPGKEGRSVLDQPDQDSPVPVTYRPYQLRPNHDDLEPASHGWTTGHQAWSGGRYDQWIKAKDGIAMGYFDQTDVLRTYRELADKFTVCDAYHASVMGETSSNRNYLFSGFGGWEPNDGSKSAGKRVTGAEAHDRENPGRGGNPSPLGYNWPSYPEILEVNQDPFGADGISWRVYQGWDNFYDNNLEFHAEFKRIAQAVLKEAGFSDISLFAFYDRLRNEDNETREKEADRLNKAAASKLTPAEKSLYDRGLYRCPPAPEGQNTDFVHEFAKDVKAGQVPRVSYLVTSAADSEHPNGSTPEQGQAIVRQVLDVIASDKDMWDSTVLFISYDENDGFFDHVPPPVPRPEVKDEYAARLTGATWPIGLGNRVPMIVVSPWTVGGYVNSQVFDHTSQVRFLEEWLGVRQPAISRWRRTVAGDLTSVFDFDRTEALPSPPENPDPRPARPLPYQPDAHGTLDRTAEAVVVALSNSGTASAHLTLYAYDVHEQPQHFDVLGTSPIPAAVPLKDGAYDFYVTGPNGFRREFAGHSAGAAIDTELATTIAATPARTLTLTVTLTVTITGPKPQNVTVKPRSYSTAQAQQGTVTAGKPLVLTWNTEDANGWYDLDVSIAEDPSFRRRLMGHIENGRPSVSG